MTVKKTILNKLIINVKMLVRLHTIGLINLFKILKNFSLPIKY